MERGVFLPSLQIFCFSDLEAEKVEAISTAGWYSEPRIDKNNNNNNY